MWVLPSSRKMSKVSACWRRLSLSTSQGHGMDLFLQQSSSRSSRSCSTLFERSHRSDSCLASEVNSSYFGSHSQWSKYAKDWSNIRNDGVEFQKDYSNACTGLVELSRSAKILNPKLWAHVRSLIAWRPLRRTYLNRVSLWNLGGFYPLVLSLTAFETPLLPWK